MSYDKRCKVASRAIRENANLDDLGHIHVTLLWITPQCSFQTYRPLKDVRADKFYRY